MAAGLVGRAQPPVALLSVIIPAHNAQTTIGPAFAGLADQTFHGDWEVIVVDNASNDATASLATASPVVSQLVRIAGGGPAGSRNAGAAVARGENLAFLDADCRPTKSWLTAGVRALEHADLVQGATLPDPDQRIGPFDRTLSVGGWTGLYESANLFMRRGLFDRIGGFQPWVGVGSENARPFGEDVRFGWQAQRLAARICFCAQALVYHAVFPRAVFAYVGERARARRFAELARAVPELREHFFYRRCFLSERTAAFDLALIGCLLGVVSREPLAATAIAPYARRLMRHGSRTGLRRAPKVIAADLAADSVGFVSLVIGSASSRSLVL